MPDAAVPACLAALLVLSLCVAPGAAQTTPAAPSQRLQALVSRAAHDVLAKFAKIGLTEKDLAITLVDLRDANKPAQASYHGDVPIYPASVVKLFYLVAAHRWMEDGKLPDTPELRRALHDMIVDSSNDATSYVVDALSGTTSGPELPPDEMNVWSEKRNIVNRYYAGLGYGNINTNQKPWGDGPYGRERVFVGLNYENRNKLTTDATARLLTDIVTGHAISAAHSAQMRELLQRDPYGKSDDPDDQSHGFAGIALTQPLLAGARLWSKAGWTSNTRHDAAYLELPNGARFVLVTFTTDHATERDIIPTVARIVIAGLSDATQGRVR